MKAKFFLFVTLLVFSVFTGFSQRRYSGSHHTTSHGGQYSGSHGSSHRGGHYKNSRTNNHYGRHKK